MSRSAERDARDRMADIYERYSPNIAAYSLRRAAPPDAADVVAETFLVAWRRIGVVPDEPNTLPWLYGVARRVIANQRRTEQRRGRLKERLATEFIRHSEVRSASDTSDDAGRVANAMAKLSNDDAELLRLIAWEDLTPSEVAAAMDLVPSTARQRISRARRRLQKHLDEDGHDQDLTEVEETVPTPRPGPQTCNRVREVGGPGDDRALLHAFRGGMTS